MAIRRNRVLVLPVLVVAATACLAWWWWGRDVESWWTARRFVEALRSSDCAAARRYVEPGPYLHEPSPGQTCEPHRYGLPDELSGYTLSWAGVKDGRRATQTSVGLRVPDELTGYSLHMVRRSGRWVIDSVDVST